MQHARGTRLRSKSAARMLQARPTLLDYVSLRANCRFCATPNSVLVPRPFCAQRACGCAAPALSPLFVCPRCSCGAGGRHEGVEVMEGSALTSWQQLLQLRALCHHCNTTGRVRTNVVLACVRIPVLTRPSASAGAQPKVKFICEANGRRCVSHTERLVRLVGAHCAAIAGAHSALRAAACVRIQWKHRGRPPRVLGWRAGAPLITGPQSSAPLLQP